MAECNLATLIDQACENKFTCLEDERIARGVLLQLLCNLSEGGGIGGCCESVALTKTVFLTPALPFVYTATNRAVVEVEWTAEGTSDAAQLKAARTGVPQVWLIYTQDGTTNIGQNSLRLAPGDTLTLTDASTGPGQSLGVISVIVYEE